MWRDSLSKQMTYVTQQEVQTCLTSINIPHVHVKLNGYRQKSQANVLVA